MPPQTSSMLTAEEVAALLPLPEDANLDDIPIQFLDTASGKKEVQGSDDYAYLEEYVLPTLLPVLHALCNKVDKQGYPDVPKGSDQDPAKFNPVRWLAQGLLRGTTMDALKIAEADDRSLYEERLDQIAEIRKAQRVAREGKIKQLIKQQEVEKAEAVAKKAEDKRKEEEQLALNAETEAQTRAEEHKNAMEKKVISFVNQDADRMSGLLDLRERCYELTRTFDFAASTNIQDIHDSLQWEVCRFLCEQTVASYVAVAQLMGPARDALCHVLAAQMIEVTPEAPPAPEPPAKGGEEGGEDEEEDAVEEPKVERQWAYERAALAPYGDLNAYVLQKGEGLTWPSVVRGREALVVPDTKFTNGVVFFDGEKKQGTYLSVPVASSFQEVKPSIYGQGEGEEEEGGEEDEEDEEGAGKKEKKDPLELPFLFGALCADTFNSYDEEGELRELRDEDLPLFKAASFLLGEQMQAATLAFAAEGRRRALTAFAATVTDPACSVADASRATVAALTAVLRTDWRVSIGVLEAPERLCFTDVAFERAEAPKVRVVRETDAPLDDQCTMSFKALNRMKTQSESHIDAGLDHVIRAAAPIRDPTSRGGGGVLYVEAAPDLTPHSVLLDADNLAFVESVARLLGGVLREPAASVSRSLRIEAEGTCGAEGELGAMLESGTALLQRHLTGSDGKAMVGVLQDARSMRVFFADAGIALNASARPTGGILRASSGSSKTVHKGAVVPVSDIPLCGLVLDSGGDTVLDDVRICSPLVDASSSPGGMPFGLLYVECVAEDGSVHDKRLMEAAGRALSHAMLLVEFRRKFAVAALPALRSLLTRRPEVGGVCVAFLDAAGRKVAAGVEGEVVEGLEAGGKVDAELDAAMSWFHVTVGKNHPSDDSGVSVQREGSPALASGELCAVVGCRSRALDASEASMFGQTLTEAVFDAAQQLSWVAGEIAREGVMAERLGEEQERGGREELVYGSLPYTLAEQTLLRTHFAVARYDAATATVVENLDSQFLTFIRRGGLQLPGSLMRLMQGVMYMLGHKHSEVKEWPSCRKLISMHLAKELAIQKVRDKVKKHKFQLSAQAVQGLDPATVAMEAGPGALALLRWLEVMQEVRVEALSGRMDALRCSYAAHNLGPPPATLLEEAA